MTMRQHRRRHIRQQNRLRTYFVFDWFTDEFAGVVQEWEVTRAARTKATKDQPGRTRGEGSGT